MSKFLFPSIRVSFMVLPKPLQCDFNKKFHSVPDVVPLTTQKTLELFMSSGDWEKYLRRVKIKFKRKHDLLLSSLKSEFGDNIRIEGSGAGLHILIEPLFSSNTSELIEKAKNVGIDITPTSNLWYDDNGLSNKLILIGFGSIKLHEIPLAVNLLKHSWLS